MLQRLQPAIASRSSRRSSRLTTKIWQPPGSGTGPAACVWFNPAWDVQPRGARLSGESDGGNCHDPAIYNAACVTLLGEPASCDGRSAQLGRRAVRARRHRHQVAVDEPEFSARRSARASSAARCAADTNGRSDTRAARRSGPRTDRRAAARSGPSSSGGQAAQTAWAGSEAATSTVTVAGRSEAGLSPTAS